MKRMMAAWAIVVVESAAVAQVESVVNSPHNLSAGGPGSVRAAAEDQVCIFCHTPHNATPIRPLWNRAMPVDAYTIYASRSLDALPGQPTGTSKMCLSCHDGTIALGSVQSRATPIMMAGGVTTIPNDRRSNLTTDLADDHPISFRYDSTLSSRDSRIKDPVVIPREVVLDMNSELQCTTCHNAHDNSRGRFLVLANDRSQLCVSCHQVGTTSIAAHSDCSACHQPHGAPSGPYLLKGPTIGETCNACHNGLQLRAANIAAEIRKISAHDTGSQVDPPPPAADHASCADCHEPHTMSAGLGSPPVMHPSFGRIDGVSASGAPIASAQSEEEVCFKCHADSTTQNPFVSRRIVQANTRLEFSPGAVSYHPVAAPGRNSNVPSLRPGWTTASRVYCSSCHNSESGRTAGGAGADGVHGSMHEPLLVARYETADFTTESAQSYALCYRCHDRANILDDRSFKEHSKHIVDERTPCAACHDAHGIASSQGTTNGNSNLINFASGIVFPNAAGRLEFRDTGTFSGECFLRCHDANHSPERYP